PGSQSLTAQDTLNTGLRGTQTGIVVAPATVTTLEIGGFPSPSTAGVAGSFSITARDAFGNIATGYSGTLHFTSSDPKANLPADATLTNGIGLFSATFFTAGSQTLRATDTVNSSITGSASVQVNAAAADHLVFLQQPTSTTAGAAISPAVTVQILDPFN